MRCSRGPGFPPGALGSNGSLGDGPAARFPPNSCSRVRAHLQLLVPKGSEVSRSLHTFKNTFEKNTTNESHQC